MPEVSGTEFLESATSYEPQTTEYPIVDAQNRKLTLTLQALERQDLFDQLNRLPGGFIDTMMSGDAEELDDVESPEDVDLDIAGSELLKHVDGEMIDVFETVFAMSAKHEDLTSIDMETLAESENVSLEVLFEVFGEVVDLSLQNPNEIKRFRGAE